MKKINKKLRNENKSLLLILEINAKNFKISSKVKSLFICHFIRKWNYEKFPNVTFYSKQGKKEQWHNWEIDHHSQDK